jgi:hypothetical protein
MPGASPQWSAEAFLARRDRRDCWVPAPGDLRLEPPLHRQPFALDLCQRRS